MSERHDRARGRVRDRLWERYGSHPNVNSIGLGLRTRGGVETDEPAVIVGVTSKYPEAELRRDQILPRELKLDGERVAVDVVRLGPFSHAALDGTYRPAWPGASIAAAGVSSAGTLGGIVNDKSSGAEMILSCAHVLSTPGGSTGQSILQPASIDHGSSPASIIGTLSRMSSNPAVDAALATPTDAGKLSNSVPAYLITAPSASQPAVGLLISTEGLGSAPMLQPGTTAVYQPIADVLGALGATLPSGATAIADIGVTVQKFGRTTAYTSSDVAQTGATVQVNGGALGSQTVYNGTVVPEFAMSGDSGAIVCLGGPGDILASTSGTSLSVAALSSAANIPDLLTHVAAISQFRDRYLATVPLGALLVSVYFVNQSTILSRIQTAVSQLGVLQLATFQALAQSLYALYEPVVLADIIDPGASGVFAAADYAQIGLLSSIALAYGFLTQREYDALTAYSAQVLLPLIGMSYDQAYAWLTSRQVYKDTVAALRRQSTRFLTPPFSQVIDAPPAVPPPTSAP